jgi:proton-dependent oligopeptide transporter, POT family
VTVSCLHITGLELAFTQAPKSLKSFVSALFWLTIGIAAAIAIGLAPVSQDPYLVWMYGSLAIVGFVAGCAYYACFFKFRRTKKVTGEVVVGTDTGEDDAELYKREAKASSDVQSSV